MDARSGSGSDGSPRGEPSGPDPPSVGPGRLHWAWIFLGLVPSLRNVALPVVILLVSGGADRDLVVYAVAGGAAVLGALLRVGSWWAFRYEVAEGELRVRSGLFSRREQSVPIERIHAIDLSESALQRLVGVVRVRVETAAGGAPGSDVTLEALPRNAATALRERLDRARHATAPPSAGETSAGATSAKETSTGGLPIVSPAAGVGGARLIRALSLRELLVAGATAGQVGPVLAFLFGAYQLIDDVLPERLWDRLSAVAPGLPVAGLVGLGLLIGLVAWALTVVATVLTYGGFELRRDGDRLLISRGLLDRRRSTIPLARVQAVVVTEGLLRQPFGLASVRIESAGWGRDAAEAGVLFPIIRSAELPALLADACPAFGPAPGPDPPVSPTLAPLPARARRRYVLEGARGAIVLTVLAVAAAALLPRAPWWWGLFALLLVPVGALWGLLRFRDTGWALDHAGRWVVRSRDVGRVTTITLRRRLQWLQVAQHVLQRRSGLATFRAAVAAGRTGSRLTLRHLDESVAFDLLDRLDTAKYPPSGRGARSSSASGPRSSSRCGTPEGPG